jgi:hypothetical protein
MTKRVYKSREAAKLHAAKASPPPKADSKRVGSGKHAHPQQRGSQENKRKR